MKIRQNLYIDRELSDALEALAAGPRGNKSHLVNDALKDWLARRRVRVSNGRGEPSGGRRLPWFPGARRDIDVLLESLALFVRYQLMVTAPLPEADTAARAIGRDRFEAFVSQVGRQIAGGKRTLSPVEPDGGAS